MINLKDLSLNGILNLLFVSAIVLNNEALIISFNDGNTLVFSDNNTIGYGA